MSNACLQLDMFGALGIPYYSLPEWSDQDVLVLREYLVYHSLGHLNDGRASKIMKDDVLDWIFSEELHPFSFIICCSALELDFTAVRQGITVCLNKMDKLAVI